MLSYLVMSMEYDLIAIVFKDLDRLDDIILDDPLLIPQPKQVSNLEKKIAHVLSSDSTFTFLGMEKDLTLTDGLTSFLEDHTNISLEYMEPSELDSELLDKKSEWDLLDVNNPEAYNLEITKGHVMIYGLYEHGLFYGVQTLIQLLKNALLSRAPSLKKDKLILPEVEIMDTSDLKIRGVAQDISRGQVFTVENAKRYIDILAHHKMNFYCVYLEDMFVHPKHPKIGKDRGALTSEEIKEIDQHASKDQQSDRNSTQENKDVETENMEANSLDFDIPPEIDLEEI